MDPEILYDHPNDKSRLSDLDREVIYDAARKANVTEVHVTRTASSPEQQARAMFTNCRDQGPQSQLELYGPFGDQVVMVFIDSMRNGLGTDDTIAAMTAKIRELGPEKVSHHCVSDWSRLHVIDLSASRIPRARHAAFEKAIAEDKRISRHFSPYTPNNDPAFHIEIEQVA